jgi:Rod binding domain-containing protein
MTVPIRPVGGEAITLQAGAAPARPAPPSDLQRVASEFEAMLLRQLLSSAKMGGSGGYAEMAVDALASGITHAGGIGLARELETALGSQIRVREEAATISHSSPVPGGRSSE